MPRRQVDDLVEISRVRPVGPGPLTCRTLVITHAVAPARPARLLGEDGEGLRRRWRAARRTRRRGEQRSAIDQLVPRVGSYSRARCGGVARPRAGGTRRCCAESRSGNQLDGADVDASSSEAWPPGRADRRPAGVLDPRRRSRDSDPDGGHLRHAEPIDQLVSPRSERFLGHEDQLVGGCDVGRYGRHLLELIARDGGLELAVGQLDEKSSGGGARCRRTSARVSRSTGGGRGLDRTDRRREADAHRGTPVTAGRRSSETSDALPLVAGRAGSRPR